MNELNELLDNLSGEVTFAYSSLDNEYDDDMPYLHSNTGYKST